MIPLQITLKNFLSYRETTLDFRGLHIACICGPNGAGKSSLLEAIAWAIWGMSRVAAEDDIIHIGAKEVRVDFILQSHSSIYRVIRTRQRGQSSSLEFQIATDFQGDRPNFRPLTEKGLRSTQQIIIQHLKLDYETFINSAYLRQGRADEFMLKRPSDRKQILADLLKLSQYDKLAEQAKDKSRQLKGQLEWLEQNLESIENQLQQREEIAQKLGAVEANVVQLQADQTADQQQLLQLQTQQHGRQTWEQRLNWQKQEYQNIGVEYRRLEQELNHTQQQQKELESLLEQESIIVSGYANWQQLQAQEEVQAAKFQAYQDTQERRQMLQQQLTQETNNLQTELNQTKTKLELLLQQEQEIKDILAKQNEIEAGVEQLQIARDRVIYLDRLQMEVSPLVQRQQKLHSEIDRAQAKISARLQELYSSARQLQVQQQRQPQLQQAVMEVSGQITNLEKKRIYQQRVREKGLERRSFMERLQAHQRNYEAHLAELEQKVQLLQNPDAVCPLCDRPLDEHHWNLVVQKQQSKQQELLNHLWVVREQLTVSEREIQVLREEYRQLDQELSQYENAVEKRGQLQAQLNLTADLQYRIQEITQEVDHLERSLKAGDYGSELQQELHQIEQKLAQLNYNEKDHALARGQVERWRWAEIKQEKIKDANKKQGQINLRRPELETQITILQNKIEELQTRSSLRWNLDALEKRLSEIGYEREHHNNLIKQRQNEQKWQFRYQELGRGKEQFPQIVNRISELMQQKDKRSQDLKTIMEQIQLLNQQLESMPKFEIEIKALEEKMQDRRRQLDEQIATSGRLQQQQQHFTILQAQLDEQKTHLQTTRKQYRIYQELAQAFGKNGIQALMIENVLPQLEAETNQFLARLSANQLHVQFVTQKAGKKGRSTAKGASKLIDTLDIVIADANGTRPYETYSGGEAFRINFSIRLALAKMLAQKAGTALQMLIVDEGFGTQDQEGCDRLIAAINAIATDFSCILAVTHMPYFKEAFQSRIEILKTPNGSQISLSI